MKKRDSQLNMNQNQLIELKMKSLHKLEDKNLTDDEVEQIKDLINYIDKALEELEKEKKESTKTDWAKVFEIIINILGVGIPYLIKFLQTNKKQ